MVQGSARLQCFMKEKFKKISKNRRRWFFFLKLLGFYVKMKKPQTNLLPLMLVSKSEQCNKQKKNDKQQKMIAPLKVPLNG